MIQKNKKLQSLVLGAVLPFMTYACGSEPVKPEPIVTIVEEGSIPSEVKEDEVAQGETDELAQYKNASFDGEITNIADFYGNTPLSAYANNGSNIGSSQKVLYLSNFSPDLTNTVTQLLAGRLENRLGLDNPTQAAQTMLDSLTARCGEMGTVYNTGADNHSLFVAYLPKGANEEGQNCLEQQDKLTTAQLTGTTGVTGDDSIIQSIHDYLTTPADELPPGFAPNNGGYKQ